MGTSTNLQTRNIINSASVANLSPRTIWGKVIVYLREHHAVALHIACGDITDVRLENEVFYINTTEEFLYELLKSEDNLKDLKQALENFGIQKFEINKIQKALPKTQEDIKKLKEVFGELLIVE